MPPIPVRTVPVWAALITIVSQPLHFGDYGGMPMQILWAVLDIVTIFVLGSGLYLWVAKRRWRTQGRPELAGVAA